MAERFDATIDISDEVKGGRKIWELERIRVELDLTQDTVFLYVNGKTVAKWDRKTGKPF